MARLMRYGMSCRLYTLAHSVWHPYMVGYHLFSCGIVKGLLHLVSHIVLQSALQYMPLKSIHQHSWQTHRGVGIRRQYHAICQKWLATLYSPPPLMHFTSTWYPQSFFISGTLVCLVALIWVSQMTSEPVHLVRFVILFYDLGTGCKIPTRLQRAGDSMSSTAVTPQTCPARVLGDIRTKLLHKMRLFSIHLARLLSGSLERIRHSHPAPQSLCLLTTVSRGSGLSPRVSDVTRLAMTDAKSQQCHKYKCAIL